MRSHLYHGAGAALLLLWAAGCGEERWAKGPPLPYTPDPPRKEWKEEEIEVKADLPHAVFKTSQGDLEVVFFEDEAPYAVANFIVLAEKKFYDGLIFHRIIKDFCVQGGCPNGDGKGGPGYKFPDEFFEKYHRNLYGSLAMANSGPNTNGSQFFFNVNKAPEGNKMLDKKHVVFGKVVKGLEILEKLASVKTAPGDRPVEEQKILSLSILNKRGHPYEVRDRLPDPAAPKPAPLEKPEAKPEEKPAPKAEEKAAPKGEAKPDVKAGDAAAPKTETPPKPPAPADGKADAKP